MRGWQEPPHVEGLIFYRFVGQSNDERDTSEYGSWVVDAAFGSLIYLAVPLTLAGYWLTMRDARVGAGLAGFVTGLGFVLPVGKTAAFGGGAAAAVVAGVVAHQDDRLGWAAAAGASGALLGAFAVGSVGVTGAGAAVVTALVAGALAWRYPRGTLLASTSVHGGLLGLLVFAESADGGVFAVDPNSLVAAVVLSAFVGVMVQPWTAEVGDIVPPLLPLTVRNWFDLVPEGGVGDAVCPNCGESVDPTAPYCGNCEASLAGIVGPADAGGVGAGGASGPGGAGGAGASGDPGSTATDVPADAKAVDVPCPECGERPIEEASTGVGLLGLLIFYRWSSRTVLGCHECNRSRLWRLAGKNMLLGWWSVTALINPFVILWNVGRGAVNRGPNAELARQLAEAGVDFDYLADPVEFDPSGQADHELLLRGLLRLGVAVMVADGDADRREAAAIRDSALELFPDQDPERIEARVESYASETTNARKVANGLADTLTGEGRALALRFAAEVAVADGDVDDTEAQLLATIADELDLSYDAVEAAIGSGVSTEDAPSPAAAL